MTADAPESAPSAQDQLYRISLIRLGAAVLLINLFVVILACFFLYQSRLQGEQLAESRTRNLSQVLAENVSGTIDKINLILLSSADSIEKQLADNKIERLSLESFLKRERQYIPELNRLLVINAAGDVVFSSDGAQRNRKNVAERDYFVRLRDNPDEKLVLGKPVSGIIDGRWIQVCARRVNNRDGSFAGVVTGSIRLDHFTNDFRSINIGESGSITLRDKDLAIIVRYPVDREAGNAIGQKIIAREFRELIESGRSNATYKATYPVDNIERTYTYFKISNYPLYINVGMATRDFLAPWRQQVKWVTGITSVFILLTFFSAWALNSKWKRDEQAKTLKLRNEKRLQSIVSILQYRAETIQEFLDNALNEAIKLTDSRIGYIFFYLEESKQFVLNSWSNEVMKECSVVNPQTCYELDKTGVWGEAVRQRKPIIMNDFTADNQLKKGYPDGHVVLNKFMTVPVFKAGAIVAVVGAANKASDYDETDVLQLTLLMDVVWQFVEGKRGEEDRRHLFDIIERSMNEIYLFDAETLTFRHVNQGALANLQYSLEEIKTLTPLDIEPDTTIASFRTKIKPLLENETEKLNYESVHRRADGTLYPVVVNLQLVAAGDQRLFLAVINDITDRKLAEESEALLLVQLHQSQKLESIGRLAGGVAHDFNNKLMVILGNAELATMDMDVDAKTLEYLQEITRAAEHSREITAQLLAFSRRQTITPRILDANRVIAEARKTLSRLIGEHIKVTFKPADGLWNIAIDPVQIDQIVMNMAVNAQDAMPDGGVFTIETANATLHGPLPGTLNDCPAGDYVRITFSDTGCGMDEQTVQHIFEPFFTTKEPGKGTGLGLSTIYGIISQNNGSIAVTSAPDSGTVFSVFLPRHDAPVEETQPAVKKPVSGSGTILVVEDEEPVRKISSLFLRKFGYTVYEAANPARALEIAADPLLKLDLVMTDITMPEMNGNVMAKMIKDSRPDIKILYVSGHAPDSVPLDLAEPGNNFIEKPYNMEKLGERLKQILTCKGA